MTGIDERREAILRRRHEADSKLRYLRDGWAKALQTLVSQSRHHNLYSVHTWEEDKHGRLSYFVKVVPYQRPFDPAYPSTGDGFLLENYCRYFEDGELHAFVKMYPPLSGDMHRYPTPLPAAGDRVLLSVAAEWIARDLVERDSGS